MPPETMSSDYDRSLSKGPDAAGQQHRPRSPPMQRGQRSNDALHASPSFSSAEDFYRTFTSPTSFPTQGPPFSHNPLDMTSLSAARQRPSNAANGSSHTRSSTGPQPGFRSTSTPVAGSSNLQATSFSRPAVRNLVDRFNQPVAPSSSASKAPIPPSTSASRYRARSSIGGPPTSMVPSLAAAPTMASKARTSKDVDSTQNKLYKPRLTAQQRYPPALGPAKENINAVLTRRPVGTSSQISQQFGGPSRSSQQMSGTRPLLFGEVLADPNAMHELGYGIQHNGHVRRGSEGSMHFPNALFPREEYPARDQLQNAPHIPGLGFESLYADHFTQPYGHRKSRSETYGAFTDAMTVDIPSMRTSGSSSPVSSIDRSRIESPRSRIPVRTFSPHKSPEPRSPHSSPIPPSTASNAGTHRRNAAKTSNAAHGRRSPPKTPPTLTPRRYGDARERSPTSNASLKAVIHAPLPKTSPPLRKSRSRQNLSSTTASAGDYTGDPVKNASPRTRHKGSASDRHSPAKVKKVVGPGGDYFAARRTHLDEASREDLQLNGQTPPSSRPGSLTRENTEPLPQLSPPLGTPRVEIHQADDPDQLEQDSEHHLGDRLDGIGKLTLETTLLPQPGDAQPLTASTEFEESPIFENIPGQFPKASPEFEKNSPQVEAGADLVPDSEQTPQPNIGAFFSDDHLEISTPPEESSELHQHDGQARAESPSASSQAGTVFAEDQISERSDPEDAAIPIMLGGTTPATANLQEPWGLEEQRRMEEFLPPHSWQELDTPNPEEGISFVDDGSESPIDPYQSRSPALQTGRFADPIVDVRDSVLATSDSSGNVSLGNHAASSTAHGVPNRSKESVQVPSASQNKSQSPISESEAKQLQQKVHLVDAILKSYLHNDGITSDLAAHSQKLLTEDFGDGMARRVDWNSKEKTTVFLDALLRDLEEELDRLQGNPPRHFHHRKSQWRVANRYEFESPDLDYSPGTSSIYGRPPWSTSPEVGGTRSSRISERPPELPEIVGTGEGLGLAIRVTPPEENNHASSPPPRPSYSPPLPPADGESLDNVAELAQRTFSPPDPSDYSTTTDETIAQLPNISYPQVPRPGIPRKSIDPETELGKRLANRIRVIKEIVSSEDSMKQDFTVLCGIWMESSRVLLGEQQRITIFGNAPEVLALVTKLDKAFKDTAKPVYVMEQNSKWLAEDNRKSSPKPEIINLDQEADFQTRFGSVFLRHRDEIEKVYSAFLRNNANSTRLVGMLVKDPKFQQWQNLAKEQSKDLTYAWDLDSMLVKPLQRLTKYPLLLSELLKVTDEDHPDRGDLQAAVEELLKITKKINDEGKRNEAVDQARKKSQPASWQSVMSKMKGRKKSKTQPGENDIANDEEYDAISQKFGGHFFQLQIVMRDAEKYLEDCTRCAQAAAAVAMQFDANINIEGRGRTTHPEAESKWRSYEQALRELATVTLLEHVANVQKCVIDPIKTLWKLHGTPQLMMQKRKKRVNDYLKLKAQRDAGAKLDKKVAESYEEWEALNDLLKLELPRLYELTRKLVQVCGQNLIELQKSWMMATHLKLRPIVDQVRLDKDFRTDMEDIVLDFRADFDYTEGWLKELAICNRSLMSDISSLMSPTASSASSMTMAPELESPSFKGPLIPPTHSRRTQSIGSEKSIRSVIWSPVPPKPENFSPIEMSRPAIAQPAANQFNYNNTYRERDRANSTASQATRGSLTPKGLLPLATATGFFSPPTRPSTAQGGRAHEPPPVSYHNSSNNPGRLSQDSQGGRPNTGSTYQSGGQNSYGRTSSVFSSAMPMSDNSASTTRPATPEAHEEHVLFLAASLFEFNIAHDRREGGIPYLVYAPGEVSTCRRHNFRK